VTRLLLVALLCVAELSAACAPLDTAEAFVSDHGTVYVCDTEQGCPGGLDEYCWDGSERELERQLGASCHAETWDERRWPAFAGCAYGCSPHAGCDAFCGCFCPPDGAL
jgi:hypothetical protein